MTYIQTLEKKFQKLEKKLEKTPESCTLVRARILKAAASTEAQIAAAKRKAA